MSNEDLFHWLPLPGGIRPEIEKRSRRSQRPPLFDGFLAGPENRLTEALVHWILEGIPRFAENGASASPPKHSLSDKKISLPFPQASYPLAPQSSSQHQTRFPAIVDYIPCRYVPHLFPIVFHGPPGCGKSHLANGIYELYRHTYPRSTGVCLTGNDFFRHFTNALAKQEMREYRVLFENSDIVVIDDIDFLEERPAGQEELLSILELCRKTQSLVVLTMSEFPGLSKHFMDRLTARLVAGMTVPVRFPSTPVRKFLISRMANYYGLELLPEVVNLLTDSLPPSVEGMHGTILQLVHVKQRLGKDLTLARVRTLLEERQPHHVWTLEEIARKVAKYYAVRIGDMRSASRMKTNVLSRNMTIYLARNLTDLTLQQLGRWFSNRDHTTILHGYRDLDARLQHDVDVQAAFKELIADLDARDALRQPDTL
ncbi:MAG: DnaA/Hda family protein [Thermoguttaceae bacterium]|nr:DnaA/Hda family protein [Thermoguttaceae bacterium]